MTCTGLIKDKATVNVNPVAKVLHPQAKVTQEVVIWGVEKNELRSLIARGLVPEDTADLIVNEYKV